MAGKPQNIIKPHNKTLLIYHLVCPVKYRRDVFTKSVTQSLKTVCLEFGPAYDMCLLEIGIDVIAIGPQVVTPEKDLHVGMSLKELTRDVAFDYQGEF